MKKLSALLFTMAITLGTAAMANAQELKVAVPFDFVVNGTTLPAATYTVARPLPNNDRDLVFLGDGHGVVANATEYDASATGTKLVFHKVSDEYFLSDVVTLNGTLHFVPSRQEKKLVKSADLQSVTIVAGS
jgi:hypothetical protein